MDSSTKARIARDIAAIKAEAAEQRRRREASARYWREVAVREYGKQAARATNTNQEA